MYKWEDKTKEELLKVIKREGFALQFVKNQDREICLEAVKQNGYVLKYVKKQDKEICIIAVKNNGYALQFVEGFYKELLELDSPYMEDYKEYFKDRIKEDIETNKDIETSEDIIIIDGIRYKKVEE